MYLLPVPTVLVANSSIEVGQGTRAVYSDGLGQISDGQGVRLDVVLQCTSKMQDLLYFKF